MKRPRVVALLDSMWGDKLGKAPRAFRINPYNRSGQRLYRLVGDVRLAVTNCCKEMQVRPSDHGKPDATWVARNLLWLKPDLLLVCGEVARRTYAASSYRARCKVIFIAHPAARNWTIAKLNATAQEIRSCL